MSGRKHSRAVRRKPAKPKPGGGCGCAQRWRGPRPYPEGVHFHGCPTQPRLRLIVPPCTCAKRECQCGGAR